MTDENAPPLADPNTSTPPLVDAWQPFTPRGVAAFAHATISRLFLVEVIVAIIAGGVFAWFLAVGWFPPIRQAIRQLPAEGTIKNQQLEVPTTLAQTLAETNFLMIVLDLEKQRNATQTADVLVEFHKRNVQTCSLFGCLFIAYPKGVEIQFNRVKLAPWWEAWEPILLGLAVLLTVLVLLVTWAFLASLYCSLVRLLGFFKDRDLNWAGSWRVASAAQMPGALLLTASIVCYGLGWLDLIRLLLFFLLHFAVGWFYVAFSPFYVRRLPVSPPEGPNPFASAAPGQNG